MHFRPDARYESHKEAKTEVRGLLTTRTTSGVIGTVAWLVLAALLTLSRRSEWTSMSLDKWGEFFAGIVAPVVFLWLILGYLQQGEEVRSNTETLRLQQQALQQQVEGTAALVRNSEQQAKAAVERLEFERSKYERLLAQKKLSIQPVFAHMDVGGRDGNYGFRYKNTGGRAKHLTVVTVEPFCEIGLVPQDLIEAGGVGTIHVSGITGFPTRLTITYIDENNEEGRMQLEIPEQGGIRVV